MYDNYQVHNSTGLRNLLDYNNKIKILTELRGQPRYLFL